MISRKHHTPRRDLMRTQQWMLQMRSASMEREAARNFIYAIGVPGNAIKFGRTNNPRHRFSSLRTSSPVELIVMGCIEAHENLERKIHDHLERHRMCGEWFRHCDDVQAVADLIAAGNVDALIAHVSIRR